LAFVVTKAHYAQIMQYAGVSLLC